MWLGVKKKSFEFLWHYCQHYQVFLCPVFFSLFFFCCICNLLFLFYNYLCHAWTKYNISPITDILIFFLSLLSSIIAFGCLLPCDDNRCLLYTDSFLWGFIKEISWIDILTLCSTVEIVHLDTIQFFVLCYVSSCRMEKTWYFYM